MEFLLLGPLEVRDGRRRLPTGGPQAEKVLAALLLARGRAVALEELIDALWDGAPPSTANHQVHKLIGGLRRRLPGLIVTSGRAYLLRPGTYPVDAARFADLSGRERIPELVAALSLWRGPALAGMDSRSLRAAAAALDERRLAVLERLTDLRLAAGQAAAVAAELPGVVAQHPLRTTLRRQLTTALHRSGRQAEAVTPDVETRGLLAEEPGPDRAG